MARVTPCRLVVSQSEARTVRLRPIRGQETSQPPNTWTWQYVIRLNKSSHNHYTRINNHIPVTSLVTAAVTSSEEISFRHGISDRHADTCQVSREMGGVTHIPATIMTCYLLFTLIGQYLPTFYVICDDLKLPKGREQIEGILG